MYKLKPYPMYESNYNSYCVRGSVKPVRRIAALDSCSRSRDYGHWYSRTVVNGGENNMPNNNGESRGVCARVDRWKTDRLCHYAGLRRVIISI